LGQTLDVLDFSAIHLSWYERSSRKYRHKIYATKQEQKTEWTKIEPVKDTARQLEERMNPKKSGKKIVWSEDAKKTVRTLHSSLPPSIFSAAACAAP